METEDPEKKAKKREEPVGSSQERRGTWIVKHDFQSREI